MTDLVDTTEMYLRTVLDLEEEGIVPLRARISERLGHSGPTVSQTISRMERDGLIEVNDDRHLELTDHGREKAIGVMRKHRLAERLLSDVIGLDWSLVHEEACRWEHVMSTEVEARLVQLLESPTESPYGNPIPALEEIGGPKTGSFLDGVQTLTEALKADKTEVKIRRFAEVLQVDVELLAQLQDAGVLPGADAKISLEGDFVRVAVEGKTAIDLDEEVARHIFVAV
ncbi:MAG: metal-dependent transcriptional regulator [Microbacteriaceae bacterium]|nr:metal-dependent transcriptional regulator [Microbacteriaceae bacterium]